MASRGVECDRKVSGEAIESSCMVLSVGDRIGDGVPTLELWSLVGEMDLARSRVPFNQSAFEQRHMRHDN